MLATPGVAFINKIRTRLDYQKVNIYIHILEEKMYSNQYSKYRSERVKKTKILKIVPCIQILSTMDFSPIVYAYVKNIGTYGK